MTRFPDGHVFYRDLAHEYPIIERAEGIYIYDTVGRRYLDASGGPLVVNIGHGVAPVADAMTAQAHKVAYAHGLQFSTRSLETYSRRLAPRVPVADPRFYFLSSGSEAIETALKFARQVQVTRGNAGRHLVISRWGSYHGATLGALAVSGRASARRLYTPMFRDMPHIEAPYCYRCPFDRAYPACDLACARQLETEILRRGPEQVAAFLAEPVSGATLGGVVPPDEYWPVIREICDKYGLLLIADEVLTGFGRTGTWFALDQWAVQADVLATAKGSTGGYCPFSITAVRREDLQAIHDTQSSFSHGGSFSHHAVGAAAALAVLEYMETHELVARAARLGAYLGGRLRESLADLTAVGDVRGRGMLWGIELVADHSTRRPYPSDAHVAHRVAARCRELGVLLYPGYGCVDGVHGDHLLVAPPYIVTEGQIDTIVDTLAQGIQDVCAR